MTSLQRKTRLSFIAFTVLLCLPLVCTSYPPLVDYPNHLARTYILAHFQSFSHYYRLLLQPIPNLAMDLVIPPLLKLLPPLLAGRAFLLGLLLLYAFGCYLLTDTLFGYESRAALFPLLFFYNSTFLMGFINYAAGIAIFLVAFSCWLRWRSHWTVLRFLGFTGLTSLCYLAHLSSLAILGICTGSILLWELATHRTRWTQPLLTGAAALPALTAYKLFMQGTGQLGPIHWSTPTGKAIGLMEIIRSYNMVLDSLALLSLLACVFFLVLTHRHFPWNPYALFPALSLLLAYLLCPKMLYTSASADVRFVWPACILLALAFPITVPPRILQLMLAIFTLHFLSIWQHWHLEDQVASRIVASFNQLPLHAKLYPAFYNTGTVDDVKQHHGYEHLACYAVITRDAFVPTVFALSGQQPIVLKTLDRYHEWSQASFHPDRYQYLWAYNAPDALHNWLLKSAVLLDQQPHDSLWRLSK